MSEFKTEIDLLRREYAALMANPDYYFHKKPKLCIRASQILTRIHELEGDTGKPIKMYAVYDPTLADDVVYSNHTPHHKNRKAVQ